MIGDLIDGELYVTPWWEERYEEAHTRIVRIKINKHRFHAITNSHDFFDALLLYDPFNGRQCGKSTEDWFKEHAELLVDFVLRVEEE